MSVEKLLPQNIEAECGVLGSIIIDPEAIVQVADFLFPDDFYRDAHRTIYEVILQLYEQREAADFITICDELERRNKLEDVGGASYITSLINQVPTSGNVEFYGHIVERNSILRRLIHAAGQIAAIAYDENDADVALDKAEQLIFNISQKHARSDFSLLRDLLSEYMNKLDQLHERRGTIVGVPTGFTDLDRLTGGLQRSDLIILAARPAIGKTSLALSLAHNTAIKHQRSVAIFSLEMSKEQLVQRLLSMDAGVDQQRLRTGWIEDDEWERITYSMGTLSEANIWIDDTAGISSIEMRSKARRLQAEHGIDLIIVDYLQLMQSVSGGGKRNENRVQEISEISRNLKGLARELNVPVLALAQLSRAVESRSSKVPQLSDLRESGCLAGETPVYLPDLGTYQPIKQLVGQRDFRVLALNTETWQLEPCPVSHAFATGHKPVYRMTTRLGRTIRATANHQFLTMQGWQRLDELAAGMRIALPRRLPGPVEATMSDEELALLGHLIGDGCTLPTHAIQYTTHELELAETVANLATTVFGDAVVPRIQREREWYQVYLPPSYRLTHRVHNPVVTWLESMGIFGLRSYEKRVPEQVFAQPVAGIASFLRHLWSTDGCIHSSNNHYPGIYYATSSVKLAHDVQSLLLRLSINATLSQHKQIGKGRNQYHVTVSGKSDIESFFNQVGALSSKKTTHQMAIVDYLAQQRPAKTNRDIVPHEAWLLFAVPAMEITGMTPDKMAIQLGHSIFRPTLYKQNLSRERASRVAQIVGSMQLAKLAQSDVYWDKIVSIEFDIEAEVYDLTIDRLHNFTASDIILHNSIEQDSDIVMFIYRDDVYNPESERKNIADIIVAKHRNGPVGQISLYFQANQTRFRDLELNPPAE